MKDCLLAGSTIDIVTFCRNANKSSDPMGGALKIFPHSNKGDILFMPVTYLMN